jgi:hypothetical protein
MVKVYNKETNEFLGRITTADLDFLQQHLERETLDDSDFYLTRETIQAFAAEGMSRLAEILTIGLGTGDAFEMRWERDELGVKETAESVTQNRT